jgi:ribosomal protein L21E
VVGTVVSVDSSAHSFVIREASGAHVTVDVTSSTAYKVGGGASTTFASLRPGESVAVIGASSPRAETAAIVVIGKASPGAAGGGVGVGFPGGFAHGTFGTVVSVDASGHSFELKPAKGAQLKVVVTSSTTFRDRSDSSAGLAQVKKGESVAVLGTTSKGVETSKTVIIGLPGGVGVGFPGGFAHGTFGTVVSVDASGHSFELKPAKGAQLKVVVTSSTTFRDRSDSSAGLAQVKKGESVAVLGTTSKGVETSKTVIIGLPGGAGGFPRPTAS